MKKSKNQKSPKAFGDLKNCISITFRLAAYTRIKNLVLKLKTKKYLLYTFELRIYAQDMDGKKGVPPLKWKYYTTFLQFLIRLFGPGRIEVVIIHGPRSSVRLRPFRRRRRYRVAGVSSAIGQPSQHLRFGTSCVSRGKL